MPISFVAAGTVATGSSPTVSMPAGIQYGDLLLLVVTVNAAITITAPSGYSSYFSHDTNPKIVVFYKFAGESESSVTIGTALSSTACAVACAYRGVSALNGNSTSKTVTSTDIGTNTLTTTYANQYVVSFYTMETGVATWTAPGSTTDRVNAAGTAALNGLLIVDELQAIAGTSTVRTATSSVSKKLSASSITFYTNDRYWVGGTATWDVTVGTKWSFTSGGAGGAPVPTAIDDVYLNAGSGAVTCTISGTRVAKTLNCTGFTGTLAGASTPALTLSGSLTFGTGMTVTYNGTTTFNASATITSNGKTHPGSISMGTAGITVTLGDALTLGAAGTLTVTQGTFTTANFALSISALAASNTLARTINLGSSAVTITGATPIQIATNTLLTFNAGTSTITCNNTGTVTFQNGAQYGTGLTFYNLSCTGATVQTINFQAKNIFNNLSIAGPASVGFITVTFNSSQTINGVLSTTGTAGNRRVLFRGVLTNAAQQLTINGTPSLTDADFRDIYVVGTAAPISGTRLSNLTGCRGINFSAPKTVYWNLAGAQNWTANAWATTPSGTPSIDNFPLAQDSAVFTNSGAAGNITIDTAIAYVGTIDASARTTAMTLNSPNPFTIYGDYKLNGSGVNQIGSISNAVTFAGRNNQIIIPQSGGNILNAINIASYGGTVSLGAGMSTVGRTLFITAGTFNTNNYSFTVGAFNTNYNNIREINFGSSSVAMFGNWETVVGFANNMSLTFNAGTSTITFAGSTAVLATDTTVTNYPVFYNLIFNSDNSTNAINIIQIDCNNLTIFSPSILVNGVRPVNIVNSIIRGTLSCAGATITQRNFLRSSTYGTSSTLNVNVLSANNCDFRDIIITGNAANTIVTNAGDCGGNSGIIFPASKNVYWNLAGAQNWIATGWANSSGGTPNINNFPLVQDTAIFNEVGAVGTVTIPSYNLGNVDMSYRTSAMTLTFSTFTPTCYGNWLFGSGVTNSGTAGGLIFSTRTSQTITSNGVTFGVAINVTNTSNGVTLLADSLIIRSGVQFSLISGTFNAVSYNVTINNFSVNNSTDAILRMGSGLWTLTGTGTVWGVTNIFRLIPDTANILLSDNTTAAKTFAGAGQVYNKLTIGGDTSTSTTTITGSNYFSEIASTKIVAHTIALGSTAQVFGAWTITGTAGNVVTLTGTGTGHSLTGSCTSGIDYLAMGSIGFSASSPGEFYAGVNSTGTAGAPVYRTAKPADSDRYWVGGTGNWSDTAKWSTGSGGGGGASVPRSHDNVIFNNLSNASSYTVTVNTVTGGVRCKAFTVTGPSTGSVTLAGTTEMFIHDNVTFPVTGMSRTYTGNITLSGSTAGKTITLNGVTLGPQGYLMVNGVNAEWSLGSAAGIGELVVFQGSLNTAGYAVTPISMTVSFSSTLWTKRTLLLGASTISIGTASAINLNNNVNLFFNCGTSSISLGIGTGTINLRGGDQTFHNVTFNTAVTGLVTHAVIGNNTFNNLTFTTATTTELGNISISGNQIINGTLSFTASTNAMSRTMLRSDTLNTTRVLTCNAISAISDIDFRDITIAGAAAPVTGTRLGDCKGNNGIIFPAAKTVYWNLASGGAITNIGWATSSTGTPAANNFPLAQDTAIFTNGGLNTGVTMNLAAVNWNLPTFDASNRTNAMTIGFGSTTPFIYGDWRMSSAVTINGLGPITFAGRTTQIISPSGSGGSLPNIDINSVGGTFILQGALSTLGITLTAGTFNANNYNVTVGSGFGTAGSSTKVLQFGSGTWTIGTFWSIGSITIVGSGIINMSQTTNKTFDGGNNNYDRITVNNSGVGALTITGNNILQNIDNTAKSIGATSITFQNNTITILSQFTASGEPGRVLSLNSNGSGLYYLYLKSGRVTTDYMNLTLSGTQNNDIWYAGSNSVNNGVYNWILETPPKISDFFMILYN